MTDEIATAESPTTAPGFTYDASFQTKIVALTMRDLTFNQRTDGLIKPEYFENPADAVLIDIFGKFYAKYRKPPDLASIATLLKAERIARRIKDDEWRDVCKAVAEAMKFKIGDRDFVIDVVADFAKERAMEDAIIKSVDLLKRKDYVGIDRLVRQALDVGANDDMNAYDYFKEIGARTEHRKKLLTGEIKADGITTGFPDLDKHLYNGGWGRGELTAIMARAKFGKSMSLGDFGKNASLAGYNVLIVTCEVSAKIYADRLDANFSETVMDLLKHKPSIVEKAVREAEAHAKPIMIHDFPSGTLKVSQLRRLVERYRHKGVVFDMIVVDYADIMMPEKTTGIPREDSRQIWVDLRALAQMENAALLTATQTNRDGAKASVASATDVAEDYNKIRTADLVISGNATEAEIAAGKARLYFAASRNQKEITLDIEQDRATMRFLKKVLGVKL
jgi:replicative DNA helicase